MLKKETLRDGIEVNIKNLKPEDMERLMEFFRSLPKQDRKYLRIDVTDKKIVEKRFRELKKGSIFRIIAVLNKKIISYGSLQIFSEDWRQNHGEIRIIVAKEFQRKGLGTIIVRELYFLATKHKVEKVIAKLMRPQIGPRKIFRKLGFREEILIPDYVMDQEHKIQDLVIMTCNMKDFWRELESFYHDSDWKRCR